MLQYIPGHLEKNKWYFANLIYNHLKKTTTNIVMITEFDYFRPKHNSRKNKHKNMSSNQTNTNIQIHY